MRAFLCAVLLIPAIASSQHRKRVSNHNASPAKVNGQNIVDAGERIVTLRSLLSDEETVKPVAEVRKITNSKMFSKKSKHGCYCSKPKKLSLLPRIISYEDGMTDWGVFWRVGLRKTIKVYAALMTAVVVIYINPWMVGEINPIFLFCFMDAMVGMLLRSPDELKISESSKLGFIMILSLKLETFVFHALFNVLVMKNRSWLGLRYHYVAIFFIIDFFYGLYLNKALLKFRQLLD